MFSIRHMALAGMLSMAAVLTGCATAYVDTATKEIPVSQMKVPTQAKPVQLTFEFQSKGAPNATATKFLNEKVQTQLVSSGMFTIAAPSNTSAILNVTINNVALNDDNPAAKGFVTGLTFGLAGSVVSDGYICTISYLPPGQTKPVVTTARHAIHTTLGNTSAPANAVKSTNLQEAVFTMTREVLSNAMRDLSYDPAFN